MKKFIKHHPAWCYYLLVFAISWGGILLLIGGPGHIPGTKEQAEKLFVPALLLLFAGPFLSGIIMHFLVNGKQGVRNLFSYHWRMNARWYAIAVFTGPVIVAAILFGLSLFNRDFLPGIMTAQDKLGSVLFGVGWGLVGGGLLEETGWTGFAVPTLRKQYSILSTGLIVGVLWGIWHFLIAFWAMDYLSAGSSQAMFIASFLAFYLVALPAYRVLLVWVYERTGSLPVVMLMHAFLSASTLILQPPAGGQVAFIWNLVLGVVLWIIAGLVLKNKREAVIEKPGKKGTTRVLGEGLRMQD